MESFATLKQSLSYIQQSLIEPAAHNKNIVWHLIDISPNHIFEKVSWQDKVINFKDDKLLISFELIYYPEQTKITPARDLYKHITGLLDITKIRDYFYYAGFGAIFDDMETVSLCELVPQDFIIMPICETNDQASKYTHIALLNKNKAYGSYLKTVYPVSTNNTNQAAETRPSKFYNLVEIAAGLQNHTSITGIQHATSFNLFRALYKSSITILHNTAGSINYKPAMPETPAFTIPILALYNGFNYFPQFQVVWTCNKIYAANIPGKPAPTNDILLEKNKLLMAKAPLSPPRIPKIMLKQYQSRAAEYKFDWLKKYKKYCNDENVHYASPVGIQARRTSIVDEKLMARMTQLSLCVKEMSSTS